MSTTTDRRTLEAVKADAKAFYNLFPRVCFARWKVAGSIRRRRPTVGDVEHVVIANFGDAAVDGSLFKQTDRVNLLWHHLDALLAGGQIAKHFYGDQGPRWGEKSRGIDFRGFRHEIYLATPETWGAMLAIRTGPAELSQHLVTAIKRMPYAHEGGGFRVIDQRTGQAVPTPEEADYFRLCGVAYREPWERVG